MHGDLEKLVDTKLRELRPPRAPESLLPRVMAAVHKRSAGPWYTRAWFTWPLGWQVVTVTVLVVLSAAASMLLANAQAAMAAPVTTFTDRVVDDLATMSRYISVSADIGGVIWRTMLEPLVPYVFAVVVLMCIACAAFGTVLTHVTVGRMSEP